MGLRLVQKLLEDPPATPLCTFVCGDDPHAVRVTRGLVEVIKPFRAINAGGCAGMQRCGVGTMIKMRESGLGLLHLPCHPKEFFLFIFPGFLCSPIINNQDMLCSIRQALNRTQGCLASR